MTDADDVITELRSFLLSVQAAEEWNRVQKRDVFLRNTAAVVAENRKQVT